jgi:hypothetical protein
VIRAFVIYYIKPTLKNWRSLRRIAMKRLPGKDQKAAQA